MKIGVISDTHDRLPTARRAVELFKRLKVDAGIHAGDYVAPFTAELFTPAHLGDTPLHGIYGNNDGERDGLKKMLPQIVDGPLRLELGGKSVAVAHYVDWFNPADHAEADVLISGHNHEAGVAQKDGKLYLNPGECCGWLTERCTVAMLDLETLQADIVEVHP